jgi:nitrogen fixation/metabolism regulation signal transduction histidine kinase
MGSVAAVAFLPAGAIVASPRVLGLAAAGIAQGNLSERVPVHGRDEFAGLAVAFNDMAEQLESRRDELAAERLRVRRATERLGAALAAGNAPERLLLVIAESAHEATGAAAAVVLRGGEVAATAGEPALGGDPIHRDLSRTDRVSRCGCPVPLPAPLRRDDPRRARAPGRR